MVLMKQNFGFATSLADDFDWCRMAGRYGKAPPPPSAQMLSCSTVGLGFLQNVLRATFCAMAAKLRT